MPYEIRHNGSEWCVHNQDTGENKGCSPTKQEAQAHMDAMYANENKSTSDKMMMLLTQAEANYTPVSTARGKACSGCRFFCGDHCHIVMGEIAPNGYCDRYEAPPVMEEPAPMPVTIVEPEMEMGEMSADEQGLFDRIWGRIQKALRPEVSEGAFTVQKDLNGEWRWIATFSNNFEDREGEIISEKAWDGYLDRVAMHLVPMPELWIAHTGGTKQGIADMVFGLGNFVTAIGHFNTLEDGERAAKFARKYPNTPLSHGFTFPKWALKDGIYDDLNVFEVSILPPPLVASNPFTEFEVNKMEKELSPNTEAALTLYFGKDKMESLKANLLQRSEEAKEAGHAFKDFAETTEQPAEAATPDVQAAFADLLSQILEGQGELLARLDASGKAYTALKVQGETDKAAADTRIKALESTVEKLTAQLSLTPRRASESAATAIDEKLAKELIGQPVPDKDTFWKA